jgi:hypothetical protein
MCSFGRWDMANSRSLLSAARAQALLAGETNASKVGKPGKKSAVTGAKMAEGEAACRQAKAKAKK